MVTHYPEVMAPPYAAILGVIVLYPVMVAIWVAFSSTGWEAQMIGCANIAQAKLE